MRLFPADFVPNLSVAPPEMPGPWVMPWYLSRKHKDRIWGLLVAGLRRFDDRLHFVELRWAERHYVQDGRIRLPRPVVIRLRGESMSTVEPAAIMEFANKWTPGTPIFDFDNVRSLESFGWLGPFKVRLLHCVMDVLLDRPPIADTQPIVDVLQEAARLLVTPVELLDFAELMLERVAFGVSIPSARALAFGDAFAGRFESIFAADVVTKVLVEAAGNDLSEPAKRALVRVGLMDGLTRMPLLDLVQDPEIRQRTIEAFSSRMGEVRSNEEPFEEKRVAELRTIDEPVKEALELPAVNVAVASPIVRDALARILEGRIDAGTKLLIDALRDGNADDFSNEDARVAGNALLRAARQKRLPAKVAMLCDAATNYLLKADAPNEALPALTFGIQYSLREAELAAAKELILKAEIFLDKITDLRHLAEYYSVSGDLYIKCRDFDAALPAFERAAELFRECGERPREADALLGIALAAMNRLDLERSAAAMDATKAIICKTSNEVGIAHIEEIVGVLRFVRADFKGAMESFEAALTGFRAHDALVDEFRVRISICEALVRTGQLSKAEILYSEIIAAEPIDSSEDLRERLAEAHIALGDMRARREEFAGALEKYTQALEILQPIESNETKAGALRAIARLKFWEDEPFHDFLQASEQFAAELHSILEIWLSKSLRAATLPAEEALPLLAECESFFQTKGLPWELCIIRGLMALFRGEPADRVEAILSPMLGARANVIASLVKAGRNKDALHALLMELPTI